MRRICGKRGGVKDGDSAGRGGENVGAARGFGEASWELFLGGIHVCVVLRSCDLEGIFWRIFLEFCSPLALFLPCFLKK